MENIDVELVVMVMVVMALVFILITGLLRENASPTTGKDWIEVIKKSRR